MNKRPRWIEVARRGKGMVPLITEPTARGWQSGIFKKFTGANFIRHYRHFDNARWYDEGELDSTVAYLKTREHRQPGFLLKLSEKIIRHYFDFHSWVRHHAKKDYSKYSNSQLAKFFWNFYSRNFYYPIAYCYIFVNRFLPEEILPEIMQKESDTQRQTKCFATLFGLDQLTDIKAEKISLRKIKTKTDLQKHWSKFKHLKRYYYYGSDYTLAEVRSRARQAQKKFDEKIELPNENSKETKAIIKRLDLSRTTALKIYGAKRIAQASNVFDETAVSNISMIDPLLLEIAKRLKLQRSELIMCLGQEIVESLKNGVEPSLRILLRERAKSNALVLENGHVKIYSGKDYEKYYKREVRKQDRSGKIRHLRGQAASSGYAVGTVKILLDPGEIKKIKKGDILIAPATYPALVPAMEQAAAIVTDEGGLLSHAAIVSREIGIPCVVGTKIATKVFKDGDRVEVDANKGTVKKL